MKVPFESPEYIAAYIRSMYAAVAHEKYETEDSWVSDEITFLTYEAPHKLIDVVLRVLEVNPPEDILCVLAAGPLENYLVYGGEDAIENIESLVEINPKLRNLLGGVWQSSMSDESWERVVKIRDTTGWE